MLKETLAQVGQTLLRLFIDGISVSLVMLFVALVVYGIWRIVRVVKSRFHEVNVYPVKNEAEKNREIYNELVGLRAITGGDRVYVARFHNGVEFLPSHPAWKVSKTHEMVKSGVTYESAKMQNILVSLIPDVIGAIITGSTSVPGFTVLDCTSCQFMNRCLKENRRVIVIQVDDMESSFWKYHLSNENIKTVMMCGIANGGNVYGYVGVDFCGHSLSQDQILEMKKHLCEITEKIQFQLRFRKLLD